VEWGLDVMHNFHTITYLHEAKEKGEEKKDGTTKQSDDDGGGGGGGLFMMMICRMNHNYTNRKKSSKKVKVCIGFTYFYSRQEYLPKKLLYKVRPKQLLLQCLHKVMNLFQHTTISIYLCICNIFSFTHQFTMYFATSLIPYYSFAK
jgi:hypothetical protein